MPYCADLGDIRLASSEINQAFICTIGTLTAPSGYRGNGRRRERGGGGGGGGGITTWQEDANVRQT